MTYKKGVAPILPVNSGGISNWTVLFPIITTAAPSCWRGDNSGCEGVTMFAFLEPSYI